MNPSLVLDEICWHAGLPLAADEAEKAWQQGQPFEFMPGDNVPHEVRHDVDQVSWWVTHRYKDAH